jgi:hypothetical protein
VSGLGGAVFGWRPSYWVAEILGYDPTYTYKRRFIRGKKDYLRANSKGSRGVYVYYTLESGKLYQVCERWTRRYFCVVDQHGNIIKLTGAETKQWLKENILELMYIRPRNNA